MASIRTRAKAVRPVRSDTARPVPARPGRLCRPCLLYGPFYRPGPETGIASTTITTSDGLLRRRVLQRNTIFTGRKFFYFFFLFSIIQIITESRPFSVGQYAARFFICHRVTCFAYMCGMPSEVTILIKQTL